VSGVFTQPRAWSGVIVVAPQQVSETAGTPLLERGVINGIVHEVILKAVPALRAIKNRARSVERVHRSARSQTLKVWIKRVALVAKNHEPPAGGTSKRVKVLIAAAVKAREIQIIFLNVRIAHDAPCGLTTQSRGRGRSGARDATLTTATLAQRMGRPRCSHHQSLSPLKASATFGSMCIQNSSTCRCTRPGTGR